MSAIHPDITSTLPASLQRIVHALRQSTTLRPMQLKRIVEEAGVQAADLMPWADFEHPVTDSYGRKLAYKEARFEIMVMSWLPGDFSGLHDHGYTQYGAVQVFGEAEHAAFHVEEDTIRTLARWTLRPGEVISVSHSLVHQMGNPGREPFLSLHVYGTPEAHENITGEARVFDLERQVIQRVDGGVFFALPPEAVLREEPGPEADFPTYLRYLVEWQRRLQRMAEAGIERAAQELPRVMAAIESAAHRERLAFCVRERTNAEGHSTDSVYWKILNQELREMARLQRSQRPASDDAFERYAELYDAVIGRHCLRDFMADYLRFFATQCNFDFSKVKVLSAGCGTGLAERFMIDELGVKPENLLGIDISPAMVTVAQKRIRAKTGDICAFGEDAGAWDLVFSGLNVYQYLSPVQFEQAVQNTADLLRSGGWFAGDFITPDHIRWYPNVIFSDDGNVISLRTPHLLEDSGRLFQESEIVNISFSKGYMEVSDAGRHRRFLPALDRVRHLFERWFDRVLIYDAVTRELVHPDADSCASTRYVIFARKK